MEALFKLLFKHQPFIFRNGDLTWAVDVSTGWIALLSVSLLGFVFWLYLRSTPPLPLNVKLTLAFVRLGLVGLLLVCLFQPVIEISAVVPRQNFVALLVDDSQSMRIADERDGTRSETARKLLAQTHRFSQQLAEKFQLRYYRFSSGISRSEQPPALTASGLATDLAKAIETVVNDFRGLPLSAIVVLSDGAHNASTAVAPLLNRLVADQVPLYTVGLGRADLDSDIELVKVDAPRTILQGSSVNATLTIRGRRSSPVTLLVKEGERVITSQSVKLNGDGLAQPVTISFTPSGVGFKHYVFTIEPTPEELIRENNQRDVVIQIKDEQPRVLYVEGEPRWEYGKLRAALREEKNVIFSSLLRTAKNKYYRQGIESPDELRAGFPSSREELFRYKGLIIGSVEANFFSFEQLKQVEAFVAERGGGFLMIGGRQAFTAGGYRSTPVADLLPVIILDSAERPVPLLVRANVTFNGKQHPITQLTDVLWERLPMLTVPEPLARIKPGAVTLLEGRAGQRQSVPLLVMQRYGRGRSLAWMASDSWRWQMQMPAADLSHERFWTNLVRYLVSDTPDPVMVTTDRDAYHPSDPIRIRVEVNDRAFLPIKDATVVAHVQRANSLDEAIPLSWSDEAGAYAAEIVAQGTGLQSLDVTVSKANQNIGAATTAFFVGDQRREYYQAHQHAAFLRHLAEETGGRYYTSMTVERLPEEISYTNRPSAMRVRKELWDMPINFLLLIGLAGAEWLLRKKYGLA
ncbi:MAG: glutamine amidotransferase [Acidobacteriota bacterium]|nr:glutamine amidotransferase [Blastocatellia bacterium]MDW8241133.1 glutamine amidotransferase [Acidobacteriota bacterium]